MERIKASAMLIAAVGVLLVGAAQMLDKYEMHSMRDSVVRLNRHTGEGMIASESERDGNAEFQVPQGNAATIDGVLSYGEWDKALTIELASGELLLMQADSYLYVGIRSDNLGLGSVCVLWDEEISILHSSAALGTAVYGREGEGWQKKRDFTYTNRETSNSEQALEERREHLEREDWLASNRPMGNFNEMEYQIAMSDDEIRLAVTYLISPAYETSEFWPDTLGTGCRDFEPFPGDAPETVDFAPETWIPVIAANE